MNGPEDMDDWMDVFDESEGLETDTTNGQDGGGKEVLAKSQVEPGLSASIPKPPSDSPSMLSTELLQKLAEGPDGLPATFLKQAAGHLHRSDAIIDFATTVCIAVAEGKLKTSQSAELRRWAEIMYTCIIANEPQQAGVQVNYVEQLIQLAGGTEALPSPSKDITPVLDALPLKKAQGE